MFTIIALVIIAIIALILILAATRPDTFRIERSVTIKAPPEKVFGLINDLHQWEGWSPWEKVDPDVKRTYNNVASGKGAIYGWNGNKNIGEGRMEIIESLPPSKVVLQMNFIKPFESQSKIEFTLTAQSGETKVTQSMYGPNTYISKVMGIFFSMEKIIGEKYEEGLASLKEIAEK